MISSARILIVEDEGLVALDLQARLERMGYNVVDVADTADQAVEMAWKHRPDLTLMDVHLAGGSDGIGAAVQIHRELGLPIVFLTAYADAATLDRAAAAAPFGYIVKPFEESSLSASIQMALARHRAELKVQQMERWLATTLQSIGDAVISMDGAGQISFLNPEAERLTGWLRAEAIGRPYAEVLVFEPAHAGSPLAVHPVAEALAEGMTIDLAATRLLITRQGQRIPVDDTAAPTRDENGAVNGVVLVLRDRSQEERMEEEQRQIEQKMQEAQRLESLGVLAGGIAHDFNNLLGSMMLNAELASRSLPAGAPEQGRLQSILGAGERAAELCEQMLAYAGKGKYQEVAFDLSALVEDTVTLLRAAVPAEIRLATTLGRDLPPSRGDTSQLRQVITNLVINAADAIGPAAGEIHLDTRLITAEENLLRTVAVGGQLAPGEYLRLEVRDTGHGMNAATQARIFDPFFTSKFTGRGLGLAAVRGIVLGHEGALLVESAVGVGSCFHVLLPVAGVAPGGAILPITNSSQPWKSSGTILIVDDEEAIREASAAVLCDCGFQVLTAVDGQDALDLLAGAAESICCIVTDLTMPRRNGFELAREIARLYPALPVIVMSGFSAEAAAERFAQLPIRGFLQKPFSMQALENTVQQVLEQTVPPGV